MPDAKTDLTVRAKSEGFAQLRDEAGRLNDDLKEGAQNTKRGFEEAERSLTGFERAMGRAMKAVGANREAVRALKDIGGEFGKLQKQVESLEKAFKRADDARGSFFQGLAQGMGAGEFIQRGPGMGRQIAGRVAGRTMAAPFQMARGGLFQGVSGFAQGLASIPGGGLIAAPMMHAAGMAGQALQFQRAQFQALPMLGGAGIAQAMATARRDPRALVVGQEAAEKARALSVSQAEVEGRMRQRTFHRSALDTAISTGKQALFATFRADKFLKMREQQAAYEDIVTQEAGGPEALRSRTAANIREQRASQAERIAIRQFRERRAQEVKQEFFRPLREAGMRYGAMDPTQANQFAQQLAIAGGTLDPTQMMGAGVAAQTVYGVGAGVSGAFLRAGRRGGIAGGGGGAAALTQALSEGLKLGLEGSELTRFMEEMAQGISRFEQTGIPINPRSVGGIARAVSILGVGATRGQRIAAGLVGAGQRLAQQGPQTAMDVLMLQGAGFRGGGLEQLMDAMLALEQGLTGPQATAMMQALVQAGGGGAGGIFTLQRGLSRIGANIGLGEANLMARELRGDPLSEKERARIADIRSGLEVGKGVDVTEKGLLKRAEVMASDFAPNIQRQAKLTAQQLDIGKDMLTSVQNFETTTTKMADTFRDVGGPLLETISSDVQGLSKAINELVNTMKNQGILSGLAEGLGLK